jgi:hypothetical protein
VRNLFERNIVYINLFFAIVAALLLDHFPKYFSFTAFFGFPLVDYAVACFLLFMIGLAISHLLLKSESSFLSSSKLTQCLSALCVCLFLFLAIQIDWTFYHKWQPYKAVIYKEITTYLLALVPLGAILSYSYWNKGERKILDYACIMSIILLCGYMAYFLIINEWHRYNENTINFQAVLYPIVQAYLGKAIHINQMSHYGGYTYFFEPILKITGLSILTVSSLFSFLLFSALAFFAYALYQIIENKVLLVFGFIAYLLFHFFLGSLWPYELYLQYYPLRTIFPALSIFLAAYYFKKPSLKLFIFSIIVLSLGTIWSMDVGVFALGAFIAAKLFHIICDKELSSNEKIKKAIYYLAYSIITIVSTFTLFALYTKLRYGVFIDYSRMFILISTYTPSPHNNARAIISTWPDLLRGTREIAYWQHTWTIGFISYLIAIIYSGLNILRQKKDYKNTLIFSIAILGLGILTYQINNHNTQIFSQCGYPFVFLLIIFADASLKHIVGKNFSTYGYKVFSIFSILLISFATIVFYLNIQRNHITTDYVRIHEFYPEVKSSNKDVWTKEGDLGPKSTGYAKMKDIAGGNPLNFRPPWVQRAEDLENFFKDQEVDLQGKKVIIFSMWDGYLHMKLKVPSAIPYPNAYHPTWSYKWDEKYEGGGVASEKKLYEGIQNKDFDWVIMDTHMILMMAGHGYYYPKIRRLLKHSGYTVMVVPTADTWYDGWGKNVFLMYTNSNKGKCYTVYDDLVASYVEHRSDIENLVKSRRVKWECAHPFTTLPFDGSELDD